jgi:hypothetical protein
MQPTEQPTAPAPTLGPSRMPATPQSPPPSWLPPPPVRPRAWRHHHPHRGWSLTWIQPPAHLTARLLRLRLEQQAQSPPAQYHCAVAHGCARASPPPASSVRNAATACPQAPAPPRCATTRRSDCGGGGGGGRGATKGCKHRGVTGPATTRTHSCMCNWPAGHRLRAAPACSPQASGKGRRQRRRGAGEGGGGGGL